MTKKVQGGLLKIQTLLKSKYKENDKVSRQAAKNYLRGQLFKVWFWSYVSKSKKSLKDLFKLTVFKLLK